MADKEETEDSADRAAPSRLPLIIGLVLALAGGGGGFYAARAGLLPFSPGATGEAGAAATGDGSGGGTTEEQETVDFGHLVYVPVEPLVISFSDGGRSRHLRFRAELEVPGGEAQEVARVMPRIIDVLNTYLRALRISDLEESAALPRLRAQMLRRVQAVVGRTRVNDLLVMEFVLN
ncbi:MAG TPA: flagellar basal body-associated FliL family protein [Roseovarius sp.]|nr:flagellar basal body-associated FliL family protein [Roseovarius sp.]